MPKSRPTDQQLLRSVPPEQIAFLGARDWFDLVRVRFSVGMLLPHDTVVACPRSVVGKAALDEAARAGVKTLELALDKDILAAADRVVVFGDDCKEVDRALAIAKRLRKPVQRQYEDPAGHDGYIAIRSPLEVEE